MPAFPRLACAMALSLLWVAGAAAEPSAEETADIRRALTLLNVVGEEYREGVVDGAIVLPIEYDEAKIFLDEAQTRVRGAAPATAAATEASFAAVRADLLALAPLAKVRSELDALRETISHSTGVTEPVFPPGKPSASRGRALFAENCGSCHGETANGSGPDAARLDPRPADFTDPKFIRGETPFDFFHIITAGKARSAMPAWGEVLSLQDRWDLVSFVWTVHAGRTGLAEGQGVYLSACAGCHGTAGEAQGVHSAGLLTPVKPLDAPAALARRSDADLFGDVAHGIQGTAMPAFAGRLTDAQMWAAVSYLRLLSLGGDPGTEPVASTDGEARRFAGLLRLLSSEYQKAVPAGGAVVAHDLAESDILLGQLQRQLPRVQAALAERDRPAAPALATQIDQISTAVRARQPAKEVVVLAGQAAQAIEQHLPADAPAQASGQSDALAETSRLLDAALDAYRNGNPRAVYMVSDAYFLFDPLEKQLALRDAALTRRVESRFGELRGLMSTPGHAADAEAVVAAIDTDLEGARTALAPRPSRYGVAFQSGFIILREGFEVVLVIGALLAYVAKVGSPAMRAPILWGAAGGALASLLTAWALVQIFASSGATAEVLEGATMLLASAVLFFVSYWLISKAEADRWQRYIQGKVKAALAAGNMVALAGAAFLAVFREGVETVLFYKALIGSAAGDMSAVVGGFACGALGLAIVYVLYMRLGRRLPMRQFFLVTGGLLYYLSVVFAGKGVAELQGAGWVSTTPVGWMPRIDFLGLYPTVETLAVQAFLLLCVVYALIVTRRRARNERAAHVGVIVASPGGNA
jgi:high-affinity iron transporter